MRGGRDNACDRQVSKRKRTIYVPLRLDSTRTGSIGPRSAMCRASLTLSPLGGDELTMSILLRRSLVADLVHFALTHHTLLSANSRIFPSSAPSCDGARRLAASTSESSRVDGGSRDERRALESLLMSTLSDLAAVHESRRHVLALEAHPSHPVPCPTAYAVTVRPTSEPSTVVWCT
jgi:hypothetical protein